MADTTEQANDSMSSRALWLMFAKTLAFGLSFALPLILVRRLSQSDFGLYKQVFLVAGTALNVLPLGFGMSAFYFLPREREGARRGGVILNVLVFHAAVGALAFALLACWPSALASIFNSPELTAYAPAVGLVVWLWIVSFLLETLVVANQESRLSTVFIIFAQLTKTLLMVGAVWWFSTIESLIYASVAQSALQTAVLLAYLRSRFPGFWRAFDWALMREQLAYALPFGLAGLLFVAQIDLHNYFVSHRFGPAGFAVYAIGVFNLPLVGIISDSVGFVMVTRVAALQKEGRAREIVALAARAMRKLALIFFAVYALLLVVGREFLVFLFTEQYAASWPIFAVNLTLLPFYIVMSDPVLRAYSEHRFFMLKVRAVTVALLPPALWLAMERFGLVGAVAVVVAVNLVDRLAVAAKAARVLGAGWADVALLKDTGKVALAAALAAVAAALVRAFLLTGAKPLAVLIGCGVAFGLVYLLAVVLLGAVTPGEREEFRQKVLAAPRRLLGARAAGALTGGAN